MCTNRRMGKKEHRQGSSLREPGRHVAIVSTASIPWMTGTAVNPLLRAAYMAHCTDLKVTFVAPWLAKCDQDAVFPNDLSFEAPEEQEGCMREWVKQRTGLSPSFDIVWYPGRYDRTMLGIFPVGDLTKVVRDSKAEAVILEEPEHLTWFHHGPRWTECFDHVVGIIHTSYSELSRRNAGILMKGISTIFNSLLCAIHCHKVVKLSDTVQQFPRSVTMCVHGAAPSFVKAGAAKAALPEGSKRFSKGAYFLAKIVYGKGWEELLALLDYHQRHNKDKQTSHPTIDAYGSGEAFESVRSKAEKLKLSLNFLGRKDHLDPVIQDYQVFINASTSDVVATTSMEALAMGKWLICAQHPCNAFVSTFSNCLVYRSPAEFSAHLEHALKQEPPPLSAEELRNLGWEAATERMLDAGCIEAHEWPSSIATAQERMLWSMYNSVMGMEPVRMAINAGAGTLEAPADITAYDPQKARKGEPASILGWLLSLRPRIFFSIGSDVFRIGFGREFENRWQS
ncbi:g7443 [Coccomyxa elongata]